MVDGVNGNFKPIKLNGTEHSIDLNNLKGLQKTDKNKSIFETKIFDTNEDGKIDENDEVIDKNNNGKIDEDEAGILQKILNKLGGNEHNISVNSFNLDDTQNQTAFDHLTEFAKQQIAKMTGHETPTSGETQTTDYTVKSGDNLWNIAKAQLGDGASAADISNYINKIMEANNLDWYDEAHTQVMIHPNQTLKLPSTEKTEELPPEASDVEETTETGETTTTGQAETTYDVKSGDNLWNIAKAQLGDGASAADISNYINKIMEANNLDWYDEAHTQVMIHPGDKLTLPATGAAADEETTVSHADKYKLEDDTTYTSITDETQKEAYKTFMTDWKEGDTIKLGEEGSEKDYTKVTQEDGTRVFAQGVHYFGITADLKLGDEIWTDDSKVSVDGKTYTRKTEGGIHYLELDGEKFGIDDNGLPFKPEEDKTVTLNGKQYTIKKQGEEFILEDADGKKYNITAQIGVGEEISAE